MASTRITTVFQFRRDTTENWKLNKGVIPAPGEPCFDLDKHELKIGDGILTYEQLPVVGGAELNIKVDGDSVVIEDGVLKLLGFDEAAVNAQPRKNAEGKLEWVVPSTVSVEDLKQTVEDLQSDVTDIQKIVGTSSEGTSTLLERVAGLENKFEGTGEGTIDAKIDEKIKEFADLEITDDEINTIKELISYVSEHGSETATMTADIAELKDLVGLTSVADQIAAAGHMTKEEAEETLLSKVEAAATLQHVKYEISHKPVGTLVNYGDKEIRVMCPSDTQWTLQNVGATGDGSNYYLGFKAYAPEGAFSFKEDLGEIISDDTMYYFEGNDFAGIDKYGRKYSICWLAAAKYDESTKTWSYYGANSKKEKYIGFTYSVEWYDENGVKIASDCIRINLSNEYCHHTSEPYYMANVVKTISMGDTVLSAVNNNIDLPIGAGLKASEEISISEDGEISVNSISWDKISQGDTELVFDGGTSFKKE